MTCIFGHDWAGVKKLCDDTLGYPDGYVFRVFCE